MFLDLADLVPRQEGDALAQTEIYPYVKGYSLTRSLKQIGSYLSMRNLSSHIIRLGRAILAFWLLSHHKKLAELSKILSHNYFLMRLLIPAIIKLITLWFKAHFCWLVIHRNTLFILHVGLSHNPVERGSHPSWVGVNEKIDIGQVIHLRKKLLLLIRKKEEHIQRQTKPIQAITKSKFDND